MKEVYNMRHGQKNIKICNIMLKLKYFIAVLTHSLLKCDQTRDCKNKDLQTI